jgi:hypothetical protein
MKKKSKGTNYVVKNPSGTRGYYIEKKPSSYSPSFSPHPNSN